MSVESHLMEILQVASTLVLLVRDGAEVPERDSQIRRAVVALRRALAHADRRSVRRGERRHLTARERTILRLLADGKAYKDVANELGLTVSSAQSRIKGLYAKLGIHSKAEIRAIVRGTGPADTSVT